MIAPGDRMPRKRVAILISGRGSNMTALIEAAKAPDYPAEIALVLANRPDAAGLARASAEGIATTVVDHTKFGKDREGFERALQAADTSYQLQVQDYRLNLVNNLDVLQALQALETARRDVIHAQSQVKQHYWYLRVATGETL